MRSGQSAEDEVRHLDALDLNGLRAIWLSRFGHPPKLRSAGLLRLILAWRLQAEVQGGLDASTRRVLEGHGPIVREGRHLGLGAILKRSWQGRTIEVIVEQDGFRHDSTLYPSLSSIALAITGTRWNGPRFFGLRKEPA
jgi:hypothetical protein